MWTTQAPVYRTRLSLMTLVGRLALANVDAAQRMQYLVSRLALGASDSCLRTHVLPHGDVLYSADRAALERRLQGRRAGARHPRPPRGTRWRR